MATKIYSLTDETYKSLLVTDTELFLSEGEFTTDSQFQQARLDSPDEQYIVPMDTITRVEYSDKDDFVNAHHAQYIAGSNIAGMEFETDEAAAAFGKELAGRLNMTGSEKEEGLMAAALPALVPIAIGIGLFVLVLGLEDDDIMGRRGRKGAAILRLVWGILGQTGCLIILGLGIAFFGYILYDSVFNRAVIHTYERR